MTGTSDAVGFDHTKPFKTRDGREVRDFRVGGNDVWRFSGYIDGDRGSTAWRPDGREVMGHNKQLDLVNVPDASTPASEPAETDAAFLARIGSDLDDDFTDPADFKRLIALASRATIPADTGREWQDAINAAIALVEEEDRTGGTDDEEGTRIWPDSFEIADALRKLLPAPPSSTTPEHDEPKSTLADTIAWLNERRISLAKGEYPHLREQGLRSAELDVVLDRLRDVAAPERGDAEPAVSDDSFKPTHKHLKTGGLYQTLNIVTNGTNGDQNGQKMVLYRNAMLEHFVRDQVEFNDGRFEHIEATRVRAADRSRPKPNEAQDRPTLAGAFAALQPGSK